MAGSKQRVLTRPKIWRATLLTVATVLLLVGAVMQSYFSDKVHTAEFTLRRLMHPDPWRIAEVVNYSEKKSDFSMRYSGRFRDKPTYMTWSEALKLHDEIAAQVAAKAKAESGSSPKSPREMD